MHGQCEDDPEKNCIIDVMHSGAHADVLATAYSINYTTNGSI